MHGKLNFFAEQRRCTRQVLILVLIPCLLGFAMPMHRYSAFATAVVALFTASSLQAVEVVDLTPSSHAGVPTRVTVELQFGGELQLENESAVRQQVPVSAKASLVYDEVRLPGTELRSARYYHTVEGNAEVGERTKTPSLRQSRRVIVAEVTGAKRHLSAVEGPLERSEFDLLDTAADSLVLNQLVPGRELALGDTWSQEQAAMQLLTGLDSVGLCEVSSVLAEANDRYARCQMAGVVHGVKSGASAELELDAIYLFDRKVRQVTQLNIAIRENRKIGPATPGLDAVAKLRVRIEPASANSPLTPEAVARVMQGTLTEPVLIETRNAKLGFSTVHDTQWYATSTRGNKATLRRVTAEGLVAHGNIARLFARPLDSRTALADFRSDVLHSLGGDAAGIAADEQWTNRHGCRVMGVVATGKVNGTEVEWHAYQVAPPAESEHLHRLALTFTIEKSELERLGKTDRELVDQIRLLPTDELQAKLPATNR